MQKEFIWIQVLRNGVSYTIYHEEFGQGRYSYGKKDDFFRKVFSCAGRNWARDIASKFDKRMETEEEQNCFGRYVSNLALKERTEDNGLLEYQITDDDGNCLSRYCVISHTYLKEI